MNKTNKKSESSIYKGTVKKLIKQKDPSQGQENPRLSFPALFELIKQCATHIFGSLLGHDMMLLNRTHKGIYYYCSFGCHVLPFFYVLMGIN